jgi:hypothetical protein
MIARSNPRCKERGVHASLSAHADRRGDDSSQSERMEAADSSVASLDAATDTTATAAAEPRADLAVAESAITVA